MLWYPGAPERERYIIILSYVKTYNESPTDDIFHLPTLGHKLYQHDLGFYLATGNDGDDDNDEKVTAFSKTTTLFEAVIAQSSV